MKRLIGSTLFLATLCAASPPDPKLVEEHSFDVPGSADFLAVDGDTVWATNRGRVEQWSLEGKKATVEVPRPCGAMATAYGSLWVANCTGGNLYRINLKKAEVETIIPTGIGNPKGETNVVVGDGSIWVPSEDAGKIARVDPATNKVIASIEVEPHTHYLAYGLGALWAVSNPSQLLQKIDPKTNKVVGTVKVDLAPGFLAAGEGAVWVQEQGVGTVARIDPKTLEITGRAKVGEKLAYGDIDVGGGVVWVRTTEEQTFAAIDPKTLEVLARPGKAQGSGALRYTPKGIWTTAHDVKTMTWWSNPSKKKH